MREQAAKLYVDGLNLRRIGRILEVNHQSVANWVKVYSKTLPPPEAMDIIEMDEMFTFVEEKKNKSSS